MLAVNDRLGYRPTGSTWASGGPRSPRRHEPGARSDAHPACPAVPRRPGGPVSRSTASSALRPAALTAYHLLNTMIDEGFVVHLADEHRYGLGVAAFEVGSGFTRQEPLARLPPPAGRAGRPDRPRGPPRGAPRTRRPLRHRGAGARPSAAGHGRRRAPPGAPDRLGRAILAACRPAGSGALPRPRRLRRPSRQGPVLAERAAHGALPRQAARPRERGRRGDARAWRAWPRRCSTTTPIPSPARRHDLSRGRPARPHPRRRGVRRTADLLTQRLRGGRGG